MLKYEEIKLPINYNIFHLGEKMKQFFAYSLCFLVLFSCASKKELQTTNDSSMKKEVATAAKKVVLPVKKKMAPTPKDMVAQSSINCSAASDERILAVVPVEQGCELLYTKMGETKTIATASFELSYCEAVQTRISKKLETAGFDCK